MKTASLSKMKLQLNSYLKTCGREPVLVTKNGRPIAALVAVVDPDELERLQLASSPTLDAMFDHALQDIRQGRGLSHEDVWSQIESLPNSPPQKKPLRRSSTRKPKKVVRTS